MGKIVIIQKKLQQLQKMRKLALVSEIENGYRANEENLIYIKKLEYQENYKIACMIIGAIIIGITMFTEDTGKSISAGENSSWIEGVGEYVFVAIVVMFHQPVFQLLAKINPWKK